VRDLAWAVASVPLVEISESGTELFFTRSYCENAYADFLGQLEALDENPRPLENFLRERNSKLIGKRFEHLVEYWLAHNPQVDLLASNLQAPPRGQTLGEFDFIYFDKKLGKHVHLEVAGKFYLWNGKNLSFSDFVSPNKNETLARKINSLLTKQIRLSQIKEGARTLNSLGVTAVKTAACFKGYVFYPYDFGGALEIFPRGHSRGFWTEIKDIEKLDGEFWKIVERKNWISPLCCAEEYSTYEEMITRVRKYFEENDYPLLLASLEYCDAHTLCEKARYFILPDNFFE